MSKNVKKHVLETCLLSIVSRNQGLKLKKKKNALTLFLCKRKKGI